MDSKDESLVCGACKKMMSDPYILPCGHSFCLRPCLLPQAGAVTAHCIHCNVEFDTTKLKPNHNAAFQTCLILLKREEEQELEMEQQHEHNQQLENEEEIHKKTLTDGKENLKMNLERLKSSIALQVDSQKLPKDGIVGALESVGEELRVAVIKALDTIVEKLQMDSSQSIFSVAQQIAKLIKEVTTIKSVCSSLEGTTVSRDAPDKSTLQEKLQDEVSPLDEDAMKLQLTPEMQKETSDQLSNMTAKVIAKLISLNKAANDLRTTQNSLLDPQDLGAIQPLPIYKDLNTAVTAIEAILTRVFDTSMLRVEVNALNMQRKLENLSIDIEKAQKVMLSIPNVLSQLEDEKTQVGEILRILKEMQNLRKTVQDVQQSLADFNTEKYILATDVLTLVRTALDRFEFVIQGETTDDKGRKSLLNEKSTVK
ncbi:ras guanine nucleotide exchange factor [Echinococcus multilocularis]|uniref:Ras guanine nucleotide exchange factor n=1 Tax=Echinococcus multilocularis TaxID=6211 RepID=A0A068Y5H8_ECHMU|nr:ras guanine nucleotide exchange factor [Echinococcus multilocularis]